MFSKELKNFALSRPTNKVGAISFNISDNTILNRMQNKIKCKNSVLENLRLKHLTQIQNLNQNIKLKE